MEFMPGFDTIQEEIPELKSFEDKVLHTRCVETPLEEAGGTIRKLKETLKKYRSITGLGRGLAAPQIGIPQRVFITYIGDEFQAYINPIIKGASPETNLYRELCMSANALWGDIERPAVVVLSWSDIEGRGHTQSFEGFMARLLQHEYDHLEGVVCLDKALSGTIEPVSSNPLDEKLRGIEKGSART